MCDCVCPPQRAYILATHSRMAKKIMSHTSDTVNVDQC